jgi:threonyl-tRNA synthetase
MEFPIDTVRHSTAHLMAAAIKKVFPGTLFGVGPPLQNGFYYDVKLPDGKLLSDEDLITISKEMEAMKKRKLPFERKDVSIDEAIKMMEADGQKYKVELLNLLKTKGSTAALKEVGDDGLVDESADGGVSTVSFYTIGDVFLDLCRGPHVQNTSQAGAFKLNQITAAYWRGKATNDSLQRVYALCYKTDKEVQEEVNRLIEIRERDHRVLGERHNVFFFEPNTVGVGLPFWAPNGTILRKELEHLAGEYERRDGYKVVVTPELAKEELYYKSGHLPFYADSMYNAIEIDGDKYVLRPMNCPHHHMIYLNQSRSYRDLPLKVAEYGQVYRYESSGALSGLMRTRGFTQNDAHIYCRYDQAKDMFKEVMKLHSDLYALLGIENFYMRLSLPDMDKLDKYVNHPDKWTAALDVVRQAMIESNLPYKEVEGEAAFYGPKIDFQIVNAVGKEFTISTNQLDFYASERFDLTYTGADQQKHPVYVIHRAPLGSHERFVAFLIEHFKASFPTWLSPVQVRIITIHPEFNEYADKLRRFLFNAPVQTGTGGLRVEIDVSNNTLNSKVRTAQVDKVQYIVVVGKKEIEEGVLAIRLKNGKMTKLAPNDFLKRIKLECEKRVDGLVDGSKSVEQYEDNNVWSFNP